MRLELLLIDQRNKHPFNARPETEDYERAKFDGAGDARFIASVLRGLADEIDPCIQVQP